MSAKLVLYFTTSGHALYRWAGGALELEARFNADTEGLGDFRAHLQGRRGALVYVLADLAGEDFHEDQIPYLRGGDRQAVVQRRLIVVAVHSVGNELDRNQRVEFIKRAPAWLIALLGPQWVGGGRSAAELLEENTDMTFWERIAASGAASGCCSPRSPTRSNSRTGWTRSPARERGSQAFTRSRCSRRRWRRGSACAAGARSS